MVLLVVFGTGKEDIRIWPAISLEQDAWVFLNVHHGVWITDGRQTLLHLQSRGSSSLIFHKHRISLLRDLVHRLLNLWAARVWHESDNRSLLRIENWMISLTIRYRLTEKSLTHLLSISHTFIHEVSMLLLLFFLATSFAKSSFC